MVNQLDEANKIILGQVKSGAMNKDTALLVLKELNKKTESENGEIAVIGIACRFPGANNPDELWELLKAGKEKISEFPENRKVDIEPFFGDTINFAGNSYFSGGFLNEIDKFDAPFFRINPLEAELMEPDQRLFLETAYEAIEDAGYGGDRIYGTDTGVFVGIDHTHKFKGSYQWMIQNPGLLAGTGSWTGILASRLSYVFNLNGPSMVVDTACSSGLVCLHLACKALKNKECKMAVAGGVNLFLLPLNTNMLSGVESSDFSVRAFDKNAKGTVWGEGVGAVLLKPLKQALEDGDNIYAVVKGSAVKNNGTTNGITAPSAEAHRQLILEAWKNAGIDPANVSYIEAHGTGTALGDPIEIKGVNSAFRSYTDKRQFCGIGTIKTNIGHTVGASGIAAFIKVILMLKNQSMPASINFNAPNPAINFLDSALYLNDTLNSLEKDSTPRLAGVNSFGFSGTNCHIVVEEAPFTPSKGTNNSLEIFTLSALSKEALKELIGRYSKFVSDKSDKNVGDVCYTANTGRRHMDFRIAVIVQDWHNFVEVIEKLNSMDIDDILGLHARVAELGESKADLSKKAKQLVKDFAECGRNDEVILKEICDLYKVGVNIDWKELYRNENRKKVSIPVYPLERRRYWIPLVETQIKGRGKPYYTEGLNSEGGILAMVIAAPQEERHGLIQAHLKELMAKALRLEPEKLDVKEPLTNLGLDSVMALEIRNKIEIEFQSTVSAVELLQGNSISDLADKMLDRIKTDKEEVVEENEFYPLGAGQMMNLFKTKSSSNIPGLETSSKDMKGTKMKDKMEDIFQSKELVGVALEKSVEKSTAEAPLDGRTDIKELKTFMQNDLSVYLYRALPLYAVLSNEKLHPWYYEHYMNIYSQTDANGFVTFDFVEQWCPFKGFIIENTIGSKLLNSVPSIVDFVIERINADFYVIINIDEYYIPEKSYYKKQHFAHESMIYGYNNRERKFMAMGYNADGILAKMLFDYDDFNEAYENGKKYYQLTAPWAENWAVQLIKLYDYKMDYPFSIKRFLGELDNYLCATADSDKVYGLLIPKENMKLGIGVYEAIIESLKILLEGRVTLDYRAIHLLYEHKKLVYNRLEYVISKYGLTGRIIEIFHAYHNIVNQFTTARFKFMGLQHSILSSGRPTGKKMEYEVGIMPFEFEIVFDPSKYGSAIREMISIVETVQKEEKRLLNEAYDELKSYFKC